MLTQYFLNNVRRIGKPDYKPTQNDIEMINQYYAENIKFEHREKSFKFYNCELNPSKWSRFYKIDGIIFMIDLTAYHRTIINPNTNDQINEMELTLDNFQRICNTTYIFLLFLRVCCFVFFFCFFFPVLRTHWNTQKHFWLCVH